jgi:uncharacterized protein (DUF488 family)
MNFRRFNPIFTVGHSIHDTTTFCQLLKRNEIEVVLDVRSSPYSRRAPHFNRGALQQMLRANEVRYCFGGRALGGRPENPRMYVGGQADYRQMAASDQFVASIRRVARGAKVANVALLCAEADPIECHRFLLVGRALHDRGLEVQHILANSSLESHKDAEQRMLVATRLSQTDVFASSDDVLALAYERQAARYAYVEAPISHNISGFESE